MLDSAIADNPGAEVLVKVHPDVIAGKKKGYLFDLARERNCTLIGKDISPWALLDAVDKVYVVTSQMGFEALMAGKEVHCFGMPFYAGWGLTQDRVTCERRGVERSLEQVFAAAYLRYCRYINPYTGDRCELEDTIALIADQKRVLERGRGDWQAVGFSRWKRGFIGRFLGQAAQMHYLSDAGELTVAAASGPGSRVLAWASRVDDDMERQCESVDKALWRIEDGFIRSVGLGADLVDPLSLVLDSTGIYYDATRASDLEALLNDVEITPDLLERAGRLRDRLVALKLSKYNVGTTGRLSLPEGRRVLLIPGQVETDASIRKGSPELKSNLELLSAVREANPDAYIIYKPHPDVLTGGRVGGLAGELPLFDLEVRDMSMPELLEQVDEVHTLTSLTGFEALLRGLKVVTYGLPFYAGWGLTEDRLHCARRARVRSLDELVAATLILYPVYVDPESGDPVNAETAVELLVRAREKGYRRSLKGRLYNWIRRAS
ncbi:hypothetical protein GCM10011348_14020 [Marinobacterium nitratireducens]|uniref:Capsular polysaccharide export protein n=2 Tax=Marinobacterium nitratireducens TaxID=518897 RepID=A0A917ZD19_9GAMM|nr:hypothetical protein GCM10011348_14020 [Marinobacterium nitratireducens]